MRVRIISYHHYLEMRGGLREQCLCLPTGVVRSEPLVLLHLLLHAQHFRLQFGPQGGQGISDVIGQGLGGGGGGGSLNREPGPLYTRCPPVTPGSQSSAERWSQVCLPCACRLHG